MDADARLEALESENERLRDEVERLREAFGVSSYLAPIEFRLTGKEAGVLGVLLKRDQCTKDQIMSALYVPGADDEPQVKIVDVFVCKMRKKLKPFGIEVETIWGVGYRLSPEMKAKVEMLSSLARAA